MNAQQNKTALANYALSKIGGKVFNFGDGSSSDLVMSAIYDQCRRYCLEQCPWSFAQVTYSLTQLALATTIPDLNFGDGVLIAYALPPDFLTILLSSCVTSADPVCTARSFFYLPLLNYR